MIPFRCTFYGMDEILDADLTRIMREAIDRVVEEHDHIEFLFYFETDPTVLFLKEVLRARSKYYHKNISVIKVLSLKEKKPCNLSPSKDWLYFNKRYHPRMPYSIFDKIKYINVGDNEGDMTKSDDPLFVIADQCNLIFTYSYPQLFNWETSTMKRLLKRRNFAVISLISEQTAQKLTDYTEKLPDSRQIYILKRLFDGAAQATIGKELKLSGNRVRQIAQKATFDIKNMLLAEQFSDEKIKRWAIVCKCGILGMSNSSAQYACDLQILMCFLGMKYRIKTIYIEQDICFSTVASPFVSRHFYQYNKIDSYIAVTTKSQTGDAPATFCPPYDIQEYVDSDGSEDDSAWEIQKYIIERTDFVIADLSSVHNKERLEAYCAEFNTVLLDISKIDSTNIAH